MSYNVLCKVKHKFVNVKFLKIIFKINLLLEKTQSMNYLFGKKKVVTCTVNFV